MNPAFSFAQDDRPAPPFTKESVGHQIARGIRKFFRVSENRGIFAANRPVAAWKSHLFGEMQFFREMS